MPLMCPLKGCQEHKGLCIHEKMMIVVALLAIGGYLIYAVAA